MKRVNSKPLDQKILELQEHFNQLTEQEIIKIKSGITQKIKKNQKYTKYEYSFCQWQGEEYIIKLARLKINKWRQLEPFEAIAFRNWKKENPPKKVKKQNDKIKKNAFDGSIVQKLIKKFGKDNVRQSKLGFTEIKKDERIFRYYLEKEQCEINKKIFPMSLHKFCETFLKEEIS